MSDHTGSRVSDVPYGKVQAVQQKLWRALGPKGAEIVARLDKDGAFRRRTIEFWLNGGATVPTKRKHASVAPIAPSRQIVPATAIDFRPDELPDCIVGGAWKFQARYDETFAEKFADKDPKRIGSVLSGIFTEGNFSSDRHGLVDVIGRAVCFRKPMSRSALETWSTKIGKRFAEAKEEIDLLKAAPRPALDTCMPLVACGNFGAGVDDDRGFLCARVYGGRRYVGSLWGSPSVDGYARWWFLVLDVVSGSPVS